MRPFRSLQITALLSLLCVPHAFALHRVTLRNGFSYDCAREEPIGDRQTRLYLSTDTGNSFVDVPTQQIAEIESLPELPAASSPVTGAAALSVAAEPPSVPALLASAGTRHNIDVALLASIVHAESDNDRHAMSHAGAQGLMQLMPGTAAAMGVKDVFAARDNIDGGTAYLDLLLTRYRNNLALALAAYNAGPAAVDHYGGVPPYRETQAYVVRVMTEFKRRKLALAAHAN